MPYNTTWILGNNLYIQYFQNYLISLLFRNTAFFGTCMYAILWLTESLLGYLMTHFQLKKLYPIVNTTGIWTWIENKEFEVGVHGLFERPEKEHGNVSMLVQRPRFEPGISSIQMRIVITSSTCLVCLARVQDIFNSSTNPIWTISNMDIKRLYVTVWIRTWQHILICSISCPFFALSVSKYPVLRCARNSCY
jgi:hypothetical protein